MTMLEKANAAAMADVRRQLGLKPIPGDVGGGWSGVGDIGSLDLASVVRAVLLAIREPDEAMVAAPIAGKLSVDFSPTFVWHAMIDALLKEQP